MWCHPRGVDATRVRWSLAWMMRVASGLDATCVRSDATRVPGSLAQIVGLVASFPKSGRMLKTELRVKSCDCFKFGCWNFSTSRTEADATRVRVPEFSNFVWFCPFSPVSCKWRTKTQQYHILWIFNVKYAIWWFKTWIFGVETGRNNRSNKELSISPKLNLCLSSSNDLNFGL